MKKLLIIIAAIFVSGAAHAGCGPLPEWQDGQRVSVKVVGQLNGIDGTHYCRNTRVRHQPIIYYTHSRVGTQCRVKGTDVWVQVGYRSGHNITGMWFLRPDCKADTSWDGQYRKWYFGSNTQKWTGGSFSRSKQRQTLQFKHRKVVIKKR